MPPRQEISQLLPKKEQFRQERLQIKESKKKHMNFQFMLQTTYTKWKRLGKKETKKNWRKRTIRKAWKDKNFEQECKNKAPGRRNQNWDGKIPIEDKIELEKKENEKIEQEQIRQVMWKLRKKEKKFIQTDETRKIQNMAKQ